MTERNIMVDVESNRVIWQENERGKGKEKEGNKGKQLGEALIQKKLTKSSACPDLNTSL